MLAVLSFFPKQLIKILIEGAGLLRNPVTMGVRVIVLDKEKRVLLVRHNYLKGMYLPGGGVEKGETASAAASREVFEEAGISAVTPPSLLGLYLNKRGLGRDHVALFVLEEWEKAETFLHSNREISEAAFFPMDALPEDVTSATRRRIEEYFTNNFPAGGEW